MEIIHRILDLARWAPSGDNQQPWRFEIRDDHNIRIHAQDTRHHCVYDLEGHASLLAIGALLENIRIAASPHQLSPIVRKLGTNLPGAHRWEVEFRSDQAVPPDPLVAFIPLRTVQRRAMRRRRLTMLEKHALEAAVGDEYEILWFEGFSERLKIAQLLFASAKLRLTLPEAYATHAAVIEWRSQFSETKVPDQAVGLDPLSTRLMEWALVSWSRVAFLNKFLAGTLLPRLQLDLIPGLACGAHFWLLAKCPPQREEDFIQGGRAWQRLWLTATGLGLGHQPEMTPLIFGGYARRVICFSASPEAMPAAVALRRKLEHLRTPEISARAIVMARIGEGPIPRARSHRRPLSALLVRDEGEVLPSTLRD